MLYVVCSSLEASRCTHLQMQAWTPPPVAAQPVELEPSPDRGVVVDGVRHHNLQPFSGVGRPALQAFTARQYCKSAQSALNEQLESSIDFFIGLLQNIPAQRVPLFDSSEKPLCVWSDAMWELHRSPDGEMVQVVDEESGETFYSASAAIAFVVFDPSDESWHECHAGLWALG